MLFRVTHITDYRYGEPVAEAYLELRLTPPNRDVQTVREHRLVIEPVTLHGARLDTHHDHRLAMAFGLVGLRVAGVEIDDADVVSKSWPGFWGMLGGLR